MQISNKRSYLSKYCHNYCEDRGEPNGHPLVFDVRILKKSVCPPTKTPLFQVVTAKNGVMTNKVIAINIILLQKPVGQDPAPQSVSRRRSWKRPSYPVLEVRQISVTSISTSESVCGLYVAHPSCRSDVVWVCCADASLVLPTVMRACGGASAHSDFQWRMFDVPPSLYTAV